MFTINMETGFIVYLLIMLGGLLGLGIYETWRTRTQQFGISEGQLSHCSRCRLTFILKRNEKVARCPRCNALCSRARRS